MEERLGKQLSWATKAAHAHFDEGLSSIGSYPGVSQRELARHLGIEGPTLTHHLDRLTADGLVERVRGRDDRRTSSAVLTTKGRAHLRKAVSFANQLDAEFRSLFSNSELQSLRGYLQRIIDHYGRTDVDVDRAHTG